MSKTNCPRLAFGKSLYMVIIGPKSPEDVTKCEMKSGWSRYNHCSKSLVYHPSWKSHWSLLTPIHMKSLPTSKLYQVEVSSNICSKSLLYSRRSSVWSFCIGTSSHEKLANLSSVRPLLKTIVLKIKSSGYYWLQFNSPELGPITTRWLEKSTKSQLYYMYLTFKGYQTLKAMR